MNKKTYIIIAVAVLLIVLLLSIRNCTNNRQDEQTVISAVAQSTIDRLQSENEVLKSTFNTRQGAIDSLQTIIYGKDERITILNKKVAVIASSYAKEKSRLSTLSNDDAVGEFLDFAECGELPIQKYDSAYLIPICPIRTYNDIRAGFEMQVDLNQVLREKLKESESKSSDYVGLITEKDKQITDALQLNTNSEKIIIEKDKQISAEHKKYKQQKVKTWVTGGIGVVLVALAVVF